MYGIKFITAMFIIVSAVCPGAEKTEPELFRITPGMITKEFIAALRAEVGDEKASYAPYELDDFANTWIANGKTRQEYEGRKCDYLNYLERLYDKALRAASRDLSAEERAKLRGIFIPGRRYKKSVVLFFGLESEENRQIDLFADTKGEEKDDRLSKAMDAINAKYGRGTIFHLSEGLKKPWWMRRDMLTPNYTTSWSQIPVVK